MPGLGGGHPNFKYLIFAAHHSASTTKLHGVPGYRPMIHHAHRSLRRAVNLTLCQERPHTSSYEATTHLRRYTAWLDERKRKTLGVV